MNAWRAASRIGWLRRGVARAAARVALRRDRRGRPAAPYLRLADRSRYLILLYHRVNDEGAPVFPGLPVRAFERQMELLREQGPVLSLGELLDRAARADLPPGASAVTFDDGYRDNFTCALPVLRRWEIPATIFLATDAIERRIPLWHDRVFDAFARARGGSFRLGGTTLPMESSEDRHRALQRLLGAVRLLEPEPREQLIDRVLDELGDTRVHEDRMLTWDDARAMRLEGVTFGAHTATHAILSRMPAVAAEREIRASKEAIERRLGAPVDLFAYPNGTAEDYDEGVQQAVRALGFRAAVTTIWGVNDRTTDPYALRRVGAWGPDPEVAMMRLAWYRFHS